MAKQVKLDTRTARLKLPVRKKSYTNRIAVGIRLAYRRTAGPAGTWSVLGGGGAWLKRIGAADDREDADGVHILDYWQAVESARNLARAKDGSDTGKLIAVEAALSAYADDLKARGSSPYNAHQVRVHLPKALSTKTVALLNARELRRWRDSLLAKGLAPASVNRLGRMLKAALNQAADHDGRIHNREAWRTGLKGLPDAEVSRNVILNDDQVRSVVTAAPAEGPEFALLVELLALTGARTSQVARLEVGDVQADRSDARLMMPSSRKGRHKVITRRPVPVPAELALRLKQAAKGRSAHAPLMLRPNGERWGSDSIRQPFQRTVERVGLNSRTVTPYALRHSSIVRQLIAGTPTRVTASLHDTSVLMLEKTYSRHISDHTDALARRAMLTVGQPAVTNIVPLKG
jgi:integrase